MLVSFLKQTGYVATPDCFRTFGLLGAVSSFSIVHFASPLPVLVAVQPAGAWPTVPASKLTESAAATAASMAATARVTKLKVCIWSLLCLSWSSVGRGFPPSLKLRRTAEALAEAGRPRRPATLKGSPYTFAGGQPANITLARTLERRLGKRRVGR